MNDTKTIVTTKPLRLFSNNGGIFFTDSGRDIPVGSNCNLGDRSRGFKMGENGLFDFVRVSSETALTGWVLRKEIENGHPPRPPGW
jgi:hypothetical protein